MHTTSIHRPRPHASRALTLACAVAAASALCGTTAFAQSAGDDGPSVTPYRPSVSTPAALSAPGYLELEAGVIRSSGGGSPRVDGVPYTLKLAFTPDWGVRIGGDARVGQDDGNGGRIHGFGDTSIVLKRRFAVDDASAFGLEGGVSMPTGKRGISSGKADYGITGIYSADLGDYHTDLNLGATRIGAPDAGTSRTQALWAASLSKALNEQWGVVGEFSGTHQRGAQGTAQFLAAASYNVSKTLSLDAGVARSLRNGSPDWSVFTGLTVLGPRLF
ncbi:MAG: hypothetical protein JWP52_3051 [Rhizobacter sp.]|jgi:hypothetical protein|nr:hypothetical protein [Rhizobacter sp.]